MSFRLILDPADTMAIGDGRPFNQADTGRAIAASVFPPPPDTVYGAARVACALALGWDGVGNWSAEIANVMGSWTEEGNFKISGPFFSVEGAGALLPIPSHVIFGTNPDELARLEPSDQAIETDLGDLRLPGMPPFEETRDYQPMAGRWGKAGAVQKLLAGGTVTPDELGWSQNSDASLPNKPDKLPGWSLDDLAAAEYRVGLARDSVTHKAIDGQLYAAVRRGLRKCVEMFVEVDGMAWSDNATVAVPLGGETRFAFARDDTSLIPGVTTVATETYLVYFASPVVMSPPVPGKAVAGLPGTLVMATITGVASHGGRTRNTAGKGTRSPSNTVLPAGSVLFMERDGDQSRLPDRIGEKTHMGYGRFLIGEWK